MTKLVLSLPAVPLLLFLLLIVIIVPPSQSQQTGLLGYFSQIFRRPTTTGFFDTTTDVTSYVTVYPIAETSTAYFTITQTETQIETETQVELATVTETQSFSWMRWETMTETMTMTNFITETSTTVDVSLLVSVAVVTLTERTTLTSTWTAISTTTLFFDRSVTSLQTVLSVVTDCKNFYKDVLAAAEDEEETEEEDIEKRNFALQPTNVLMLEATQEPYTVMQRNSEIESSIPVAANDDYSRPNYQIYSTGLNFAD